MEATKVKEILLAAALGVVGGIIGYGVQSASEDAHLSVLAAELRPETVGLPLPAEVLDLVNDPDRSKIPPILTLLPSSVTDPTYYEYALNGIPEARRANLLAQLGDCGKLTSGPLSGKIQKARDALEKLPEQRSGRFAVLVDIKNTGRTDGLISREATIAYNDPAGYEKTAGLRLVHESGDRGRVGARSWTTVTFLLVDQPSPALSNIVKGGARSTFKLTIKDDDGDLLSVHTINYENLPRPFHP